LYVNGYLADIYFGIFFIFISANNTIYKNKFPDTATNKKPSSSVEGFLFYIFINVFY